VTGLIYVAIVALWAAVLIPMWLRRHDHDEEHRLQRHQEALGTLARFRGAGGASGSPTRRAARRRLMILVTLATLTVAGGAAWLLGLVGMWALVAPALFLAGFVTLAAVASGQESARESRRRAMETRARRRERRRVAAWQVEEFAEVERLAEADEERSFERQVRAEVQPESRPRAARMDRVFDQTA
jgi:membrane protein implicated in regulation of membrane protease activity